MKLLETNYRSEPLWHSLWLSSCVIYIWRYSSKAVSRRRVRRRAISVMWSSDVAVPTPTTRQTTHQLLTTSPYLSAP